MSEIINLSVICATHNGKNKIQNLIQSIENSMVHGYIPPTRDVNELF